MLRSTAALLMSAGFRVVWLPLEFRRFRPFWHGCGTRPVVSI
jgi:hypothetical protein